MIVSRKTVIWSGIVAVILFAIINRVWLYVNSEIVFGKIEKHYDKDVYFLEFQYKGDTFVFNDESLTEADESLPKKVLIPFETPKNYVIFDFHNFAIWIILIIIFMSGGWILFLQSFFPKRDRFFLFKTKKELDE